MPADIHIRIQGGPLCRCVSSSSAALLLQVDYQLEFAEWLLVSGTESGSKQHTPEALLLAAITTLTQLQEAAAEGALQQRACCCLSVLQMCQGCAVVTSLVGRTSATCCTELCSAHRDRLPDTPGIPMLPYRTRMLSTWRRGRCGISGLKGAYRLHNIQPDTWQQKHQS
jgi:hypothetical protein